MLVHDTRTARPRPRPAFDLATLNRRMALVLLGGTEFATPAMLLSLSLPILYSDRPRQRPSSYALLIGAADHGWILVTT
jgi:hypothetical protein